MTLRNNARLAGIAYLLYIACAFPGMLFSGRATSGADTAAQLATLAQHAGDMRLAVVLEMLGSFCALVLAVSLWALTRDVDRDLALLAAMFRVGEGVAGVAGIPLTLGLLSIVTTTSTAQDPTALQAVAAVLFKRNALVGATLFAVGSTIFCSLLLRGRMIPSWLAWLGLVGSLILSIGLPLQIVRVLTGAAAQWMWLPVAIFEITVAVWFIVKGVSPPHPGPA